MQRDERGGVRHRAFVMVGPELWGWYRKRWHELEAQWRGCPRFCLDAGREELRAEVRRRAPYDQGAYLIPV